MQNQPYSPDPRAADYAQPTEQTAYEHPAPIVSDTVQSSSAAGAYAQRQHESYVDPAGNRVENREEVFEDRNLSRANTRYWIATITYFILGVIEVILFLRLLFRFLGANQGNSFIRFLYDLSHVFVGAFNGIFNDQTIGNTGVFELSTIVAMLVYALIAWGIVSLGRVLFAPNLTGRQRFTATRRRYS